MEGKAVDDGVYRRDGPVVLVLLEKGILPSWAAGQAAAKTKHVISLFPKPGVIAVSPRDPYLEWTLDGELVPERGVNGAVCALRSVRPSHLYIAVGAVPLVSLSVAGSRYAGSIAMAVQALGFESKHISVAFPNHPEETVMSDWLTLFGDMSVLDGFAAHVALDAHIRRRECAGMDVSEPADDAPRVCAHVWCGNLSFAKERLHGFELVPRASSWQGCKTVSGALSAGLGQGKDARFVGAYRYCVSSSLCDAENLFELRLSPPAVQDDGAGVTVRDMVCSANFISAWKDSRCSLLFDIEGSSFLCSWLRVKEAGNPMPRWACVARHLSLANLRPSLFPEIAAFRRYDLEIAGRRKIVYPGPLLREIPRVVIREKENESFEFELSKGIVPTPDEFEKTLKVLARRKLNSSSGVPAAVPDGKGTTSLPICTMQTPEGTVLNQWDNANLRRDPCASSIDMAMRSSKGNPLKRQRGQADVEREDVGDAAAAALRIRRSHFPLASHSHKMHLSSRRLSLASRSISIPRKLMLPGRSTQSAVGAHRSLRITSPFAPVRRSEFQRLDHDGTSRWQEEALNELKAAKAKLLSFRVRGPESIYGVDYCSEDVGGQRGLNEAVEHYEEKRFGAGSDFDSFILPRSTRLVKPSLDSAQFQKSISRDFTEKGTTTADKPSSPFPQDRRLSNEKSKPNELQSDLVDARGLSNEKFKPTELQPDLIDATHVVLSPEEVAECLGAFVSAANKSFTAAQRQWLPRLLRANSINFTLSSRALLCSALSVEELAGILLEGREDAKGRDGVFYMIQQWIEDVRNGKVILEHRESHRAPVIH